MRLTDEQVMQDNKRFANWNCNVLAELKYCGLDIPHRKSITNDEIHFHAWLCRSAVALLKEQEAVKPSSYHHLFICPVCKTTLKREQKFCHECGKRIKWEWW